MKTDISLLIKRVIELKSEVSTSPVCAALADLLAAVSPVADTISLSGMQTDLEEEVGLAAAQSVKDRELFDTERLMKERELQQAAEVLQESDGPAGQRGGALSNSEKRDAEVKRRLSEDFEYTVARDKLTQLRLEKDNIALGLWAIRRRREVNGKILDTLNAIIGNL